MEKYILIEVIDREISEPYICDTLEDAHLKMCECIAEAYDVPVSEIRESYLNSEEYNTDCYINANCCILETSAWITDLHHKNYDYSIFKVNL